MNHRFVELLGLTSQADEHIEIIDLDMQDCISELILDMRVTHGAGGDSTEHNMKCWKKIEIIDGSDVLYSLDGLEAQALDIYNSGYHPRGGWFNKLVGTESDAQVAISFGRYLWDEELALDPKRFGNPKLRITFDKDLGGMNVSAGKLSVLAALFDEKVIAPSGFFMTKEIKRWSAAAAAHEYTECPTDYPYRKLLLQGRYAENPPHWIFSNIKLSSDQDKKVIINGEFRDLMFGMGRENAYVQELLTTGVGAAQEVCSVTPTMDVMATGTEWNEDAHGLELAAYDGDGGHLEVIGEVAANAVYHIHGWAPHGTIAIPFGKQGDISDWFDVRGIGSLKLDCTSGVAAAVQKLFIQQYRSY